MNITPHQFTMPTQTHNAHFLSLPELGIEHRALASHSRALTIGLLIILLVVNH